MIISRVSNFLAMWLLECIVATLGALKNASDPLKLPSVVQPLLSFVTSQLAQAYFESLAVQRNGGVQDNVELSPTYGLKRMHLAFCCIVKFSRLIGPSHLSNLRARQEITRNLHMEHGSCIVGTLMRFWIVCEKHISGKGLLLQATLR